MSRASLTERITLGRRSIAECAALNCCLRGSQSLNRESAPLNEAAAPVARLSSRSVACAAASIALGSTCDHLPFESTLCNDIHLNNI